jgi:hypothetical protein
MKYLLPLLLSFAVLISCTEKVGNCKKDHKRVDKAKKSGNLKNW